MDLDRVPTDPPAPWRATAAYLYVLDLDGPALAWEYLRRHADYQRDWKASGRRVHALRWGLRQRRRSRARCARCRSALGRRLGRLAAGAGSKSATTAAQPAIQPLAGARA